MCASPDFGDIVIHAVVYVCTCSFYFRGQLKLGDFGLSRLYHDEK